MGKYQVYNDKKGEFRFRLKAGNGQTILASEGYSSRAGCDNGIASVQKNCSNDASYERKTTAGGQFSFNLKAGNGQVIGVSEAYTTESARENGVESIKKNGPATDVDDQTA